MLDGSEIEMVVVVCCAACLVGFVGALCGF